MLVTSRELLKKAQRGGWAIGAFNTCDLEITKGIIEAAEELNSPVIIETSEGEMDFLSPDLAVSEVRALAKKAKIPVVLHLDHGKSFEACERAINAGYTSVHIDGSSMELSENLEITKKVVDFAKKKKLTVEGEIGHVPGSSEHHYKDILIDKENLTDPKIASDFVKKTGVDVLAVSIGNIHGIYTSLPILDIKRLKKVKELTGKLISLHGGSGIPKNQIKKAIESGVAKVNVNTELRLAFKDGILHEFNIHPDNVVPYKYLPAGREAVKKVVMEKIRLFGSDGKA